MNLALKKLAAAIIRRAETGQHADSVLRTELRQQRGLSREDGWEISRAVFAFYRWFGWLNKGESLEDQIEEALALSERFNESPGSISDEELLSKAVPAWVGDEMTIPLEWLRSLQSEPRLWLRSKHGQRDSVAKALRYSHCPELSSMPDALAYEGSVDLFRTPQFHEGLFELQDIASQAVGVICDPRPGETWWDACAGEGGKTLHLSELMQNKGLIWASDRAEWRLRKLKQRAARAKVFNYRTALWDGSERLPTKTRFDGVLVDAPCSGIGTWQRNPHARWTARPADVRELAEIQFQLLKNVAGSIKPGGKLVFSVCTLTNAETTGVVKRFQEVCPEFAPMPFANPLNGTALPDGQLCIWPQDSGGNGMFIACWRKQ